MLGLLTACETDSQARSEYSIGSDLEATHGEDLAMDAFQDSEPGECVEFETWASPEGPVCLVPWEQVRYEAAAVPAWQAIDFSWWVPAYCDQAPGSNHEQSVNCPGIAPDLACRRVLDPGSVASWLTPATAPVLCESCPKETTGGYFCLCKDDGLTLHGYGLGGQTCDYLLVPGEQGPEVLRTLADLAARFAPVETPEEALAFAELAGQGVQHRFWSGTCGSFLNDCDGYANVPTHVNGWQDWGLLGCTRSPLEATRVEPQGQDWLVHTYRVVEGNGCGWTPFSGVDVLVTRAGAVTVNASEPVCYGTVPCYD